MRTALIAATACLAAAGHASAHSDLPYAEWCKAGKVAYAADFKLTGADIASHCTHDDNPTKQRAAGAKQSGVVPAHCGQFDPPYSAARVAAGGHCASYALPGPQEQADFGTTAAIVSGPESYLSPAHHEIYRLADGVWGMCAICLPPAPAGSDPGGEPPR